MPKLGSYRRIITNDFKQEDRQLVGQVASPVNDSFNELYFAVNGRISLRDNVFCTVKDIDITVDASGFPINDAGFTLDKQGQVMGCQVIYAANQVNSALFPTGQPFVSFTQNNTQVYVNHITGLQPNSRYIVRIVAYLA